MNEKWIIIIGAASANIEIEGNKSSQALPFLHVTSYPSSNILNDRECMCLNTRIKRSNVENYKYNFIFFPTQYDPDISGSDRFLPNSDDPFPILQLVDVTQQNIKLP